VGYAGGREDSPSYESIKDYSEAVRVEFNPHVVTYEELLEVYFHHLLSSSSSSSSSLLQPPYSRQYRNLLLVHTDLQLKEIRRQMSRVRSLLSIETTGGKGGRGRLYVDVESATDFYKAEEYHQKYLQKNT
jgi:peptide-methionine (S)-S-oxide reductase